MSKATRYGQRVNAASASNMFAETRRRGTTLNKTTADDVWVGK